MKRQLLTLAVAGGLALGSLASANAQDDNTGKDWHGHGGHHRHGGPGGHPFEHMTKELNLTADQQAKVQPILDKAKPQLQAIHQDAMQKAKLVLDSTMDQVRPLLTPEQQQKMDALKATHQKKMEARQEMHDAQQQ